MHHGQTGCKSFPGGPRGCCKTGSKPAAKPHKNIQTKGNTRRQADTYSPASMVDASPPLGELGWRYPNPLPHTTQLMHSLIKIVLLAPVLGVASMSAAEPAPAQPWESSTWTVESGLLWEIGTGTPIAYRLVPTQLSWRSPEAFGWTFSDGSRLLFRHRLALIGTWIEHGPETHYLGFSGSPSLELWNKSGTWSLYTGSGGGAGFIDSQGVKGGQGQDFTLNWFIRGGIEHVTSRNAHLTAGIMYQHMSNGGQTKPNPGIDALGFTLGYGWKF